MSITDWLLSLPGFAIGVIFWVITYICAPIESKKYGKHVSGCPGVTFVCFLLGGLLSPCKWTALLCLLDFSVTVLPLYLLKQRIGTKARKNNDN